MRKPTEMRMKSRHIFFGELEYLEKDGCEGPINNFYSQGVIEKYSSIESKKYSIPNVFMVCISHVSHE